MPCLRELQSGFGRALLDGDPAAVRPFILARGIAAERRVGIYRNNMRENWVAALEAGFPVLRRLVGEAYFRQMALAYQRACPSSCGNLHFSGQRLAEFLEKHLEGSEHAYLADIARLEWLCQESAVAGDDGPLPVDRLSALSPAQLMRLHLRLHPAVRLLRSRYPIQRIWQVNQPDSAADQEINLSSGADHLLIRCTGGETELRRLPVADHVFLDALRAGRSLVDAAGDATRADPGYALADRLRLWVSLKVISGFSIQQSFSGALST